MENYNELKELKELLDHGIITQEEFEEKKRNLLGLGEKAASSIDSTIETASSDAPQAPAPETVTEVVPEAPAPQAEAVQQVIPAAAEAAGSDQVLPPQGVIKQSNLKKMLMIAGGVLAVVVIAIIIFATGKGGPENDVVGDWRCSGVVNYGNSTTVSEGTPAMKMHIKKDKTWELDATEIGQTKITGTWEFDTTQQTSSGSTVYLYDFTMDSGNTVKAAYVPGEGKDEFFAMSTKSYLDSDNCAFYNRTN